MRRALFLQNRFHDINVYYEGSQLAVDNDGRVIRFIIAKKWQDSLDVNMPTKTGWIQALVVDEKYQGQQIGSMLLRHAENSIKESRNGASFAWPRYPTLFSWYPSSE